MTLRRLLIVLALPAVCLAQATTTPQAPPPAGAAAPVDARHAEVQAAADAMAKAVLAGDGGAYLAHVWRGNAEWAREQDNWALDLTRKVPAEFSFTVGEVADGEGAGWIDAPVTQKWLFTGGKERTQSFTARFLRDADKGWLYAGEKWNVLEAAGVRVLFEDGQEEHARIVAEVLPDVRKHVLGEFGMLEAPIASRVQEVKLYKSMRHLQHSIYLSYTDGLGGWNEPGEAIKLLSGGVRDTGGARMLLGHEYGHVATFELGPKANEIPWWALEGVAELSAEEYAGGRKTTQARVHGWAEAGKLIDWSRLADFHGEATQHYDWVYRQGHHMLGYIDDTYGHQKRTAWLGAMAQGATIDDATAGVLGLTFGELDAQWRASLEK
ncbi:MAG: hypothetical protein IT437_03750 [Phycisphaerales bacterium]|nr:hypothetical protein [Phycisphaerales bacterium]